MARDGQGGAPEDDAGGKAVEEHSLQLHAEQLDVSRRRRDVSAVRVTVRATDRQELVDELLESEDIEIERRAIHEVVDEAPPIRQEGDVTVIPVFEEVLVVERRILLKEEIRLRRTTRQRRHQERVVLRTEEAVVERINPPTIDESHYRRTGSPIMSTETVIAVYDTAMRAEAAIHDLLAAGVASNAIEQYARNEEEAGTAIDEPGVDAHRHRGFWAWLTGQDDVSHEHHALYDRSVQAGGIVVTVITESTAIGHIEEILQRHDPVDLDERHSQYQAEGLYGGPGDATTGVAPGAHAAGSAPGLAYPTAQQPLATGVPAGRTAEDRAYAQGAGTDATLRGEGGYATEEDYPVGTSAGTAARPGVTTGLATGGTGLAGVAGREGATSTEEVIPLSEESLQLGKREVDRGTTRVRRYVVERPVEEQIRLRDERVSVFRRPVQAGATVAPDAFTDREITVTETDEEAVVGKTARVVEEVVVQKAVDERVETVRDTLRHDEVEIDGPSGRTAGTMTETPRRG